MRQRANKRGAAYHSEPVEVSEQIWWIVPEDGIKSADEPGIKALTSQDKLDEASEL